MHQKLSKLLFIGSLLFLFSCDFTPTINKEIVEAQEFLLTQNYVKAIAKYKEIFKKNPEKFVALAYFDMGLYKSRRYPYSNIYGYTANNSDAWRHVFNYLLCLHFHR